jgi:hypothetical protein
MNPYYFLLFLTLAGLALAGSLWHERKHRCRHPDAHTHRWMSDDGFSIVLTHCPICGWHWIGHYRSLDVERTVPATAATVPT